MKSSVSIKPRMVIGLGSMALLLFLLSNHSSNSIKNLYQNTAKSLPATTRFSRPEYTVPPPAHLPHVIKVAEDEDYVTADIKQIPEVAEAIIPTVSEEIVTSTPEVQESAVAPVQKYYHSDFPSVFGLVYLPFTIDTPEVKEILDKHDVTKDSRYRKADEYLYKAWGNVLERGPRQDDERIYVANAGGKGWGVYADEVIAEGDLIDIYTGVRTTDGSNTKYQWNYQSSPLGKDGKGRYIGTDSLVHGNWMRFVNDDKAARHNCRMVAIPYKNRWYTLYVASKEIAIGHEIFISYGANYWKKRTFF